MFEIKDRTVRISVRTLVEFILQSGDIDSSSGKQSTDAMQAGTRIHKKIQKSMGSNYQAEVPLSITIPVEYEGVCLELVIEGRADGILDQSKSKESENDPDIVIDEIKGVYRELSLITEAVPVHLAQAMCYAYIYAIDHEMKQMGVQMTYCNLETEDVKRFRQTFSSEELEEWFSHLTKELAKWAVFEYRWSKKRNENIKQLEFPFSYREGQKELVTGVYRTIIRDKKLFIEAPTGVGKTISTIFPAIKAMGEGKVTKIFYLTAKTIARTVAENTFSILKEKGLRTKVVTLTAKEKICPKERVECNPTACERAKGHYDRINDAVYDLLINESDMSRELIETYALKHMVCPFEMSLDVSLWCDAIICDYNYVFDPNVYLRRFFVEDKKMPYCFLIDEAHNLVDRAREMYSAMLYKKDFLRVKSLIKGYHTKMIRLLENCNQDMLKMKRECVEVEILQEAGSFYLHLVKLMEEYEEFLQEDIEIDQREEVLDLYFEIRHFVNMYELLDDKYIIYTDYDENSDFRIHLMCVDPSTHLRRCLDRGKASILFSATLLPIHYYKEHLGGEKEDYAIYAPSPFEKEKRLIMIGTDVTTRYSRRSKNETQKIVDYIIQTTRVRVGNYFVFFPSYQMMHATMDACEGQIDGIVMQESNMAEKEKEAFLENFVEDPMETKIGFMVMGGIFSEGIDLTGTRLIGAIIVGTGLPMVCTERELMRSYYQEEKGNGFDYAYLYHGMNKVLQSAGRVIRTSNDMGVILLLDERFRMKSYLELFPREWNPYMLVNRTTVGQQLEQFWKTV